MKKNTTKRAVLFSVIALVLCMSMFVGTTYAWFTDSVTSANNVIKAGNLDIEVEYTLGDKDANGKYIWKNLDGAEDLFSKGLWEPGHTEVVVLRVKNNGSLALKYNASINIVDETLGKTKDGADIKLSDILTVSSLSFDEAGVDPLFGFNIAQRTIEEAFKGEDNIAYSAPVAFNQGSILNADSDLKKNGDIRYIAIKVDMDETVGNEANHDGKNLPYIEFGITVAATQFTYEEDSFDNQYDKDAEYPEVVIYDHKVSTLAELKDAFKEGGNILLKEDVTFDKMTAIEPGVEVYLNLNGKTVTVDPNTKSNTLFYPKKGSTLIIDGEGTFDLGENYTMQFFYPEGKVIIENGTFIRKIPAGADMNKATSLFGGVRGSNGTDSCVIINGGYFDGGYYDPNGDPDKFVETDAAGQGKSSDKNVYRQAIKDNISAVLNLSSNSLKIYGGTFVGANPAWGDEGCALPITPEYLRPWSYYQGTYLDGQVVYDDKIVIPDGYTITEGTTEDGRPTYTVNYNK